MGQHQGGMQVLGSGVFPSIHVNSERSLFRIINGVQGIEGGIEGRMFFKYTDVEGDPLEPAKLNVQFNRACICPQGFEIVQLHIGYTYISPLKLQKPAKPDMTYVNRQLLKLSRPFVLGFVVRSVRYPKSLMYVQANTSSDTLSECVKNGHLQGIVRETHLFPDLPWQDQVVNSQFSSLQFGNAAFHTLIDIVPGRRLKLEKSATYGLDMFTSNSSTKGEQLIGIAYMKPGDVHPVCIYGYPYDLLLFKYSIAEVPSDTFYYSQSVFKSMGAQFEFVNNVIEMIQQGFETPRVLSGISEVDYLQIQKQLSQIVQGQVYLYNNNLHGKIDGIVSNICKDPIFSQDRMCSCFSMNLGSSCDQDVLGTQCRTSGYKNVAQLKQKCVFNNSNIQITQNTEVQNTNITMQEGSVLGGVFQK